MHRRIETLLATWTTFPSAPRAVERLRVSSSAMTHRVLRLPSSIGDLGLMLAGDVRVRDGDVLVADETRVIALEVIPDDRVDRLSRFDRTSGRDRARRSATGTSRSFATATRSWSVTPGRSKNCSNAAACDTSAPRASWSGRSSTRMRPHTHD